MLDNVEKRFEPDIYIHTSPYSTSIFKLQKRVVRIITGSTNKYSCHHLFIKLNILTLKTQYILLDLITQNTGHESCHYAKPKYRPQNLIHTKKLSACDLPLTRKIKFHTCTKDAKL